MTPLLHFFTDPILRGPTLGCMFMCLGAALVGVIILHRKQTLLGESLSHAAYPGVILGVLIASFLGLQESNELSLLILLCLELFLVPCWALVHWNFRK